MILMHLLDRMAVATSLLASWYAGFGHVGSVLVHVGVPWELSAPLARTVGTFLLLASTLGAFGYAALSVYIAANLAYSVPLALMRTPDTLGLDYRDVAFPAREDGVMLSGWLIPGVLPDGRLTLDRTLILVHGLRQNRTDPQMGLLELSAALARHSFGVLAFDMRGMGQSRSAPLTFGYFEQRDVLGAVDFLRSDGLPYPELAPPRAIGGWGISMGAATLLLAAAREPAIAALVSDSAYGDVLPLLQRELPRQGQVPALFTPGALLAGRVLYGADYFDVRPLDVVGRLAPRPLLFIHAGADSYVPPQNLATLAEAASAARGANVQSWLVPGASHAQAYHTAGEAYINRLVSFFSAALGSGGDASQPPAQGSQASDL